MESRGASYIRIFSENLGDRALAYGPVKDVRILSGRSKRVILGPGGEVAGRREAVDKLATV